MTTTTTIDDVVTKVRKIAAERSDFVYTNQPESKLIEPEDLECSYTSAGTHTSEGESCIVGQALQQLGYTKEQLNRVNRWKASEALKGLKIIYDDKDTKAAWLNYMQSRQDGGTEWGQCIFLADRHTPIDEDQA